MPLSSLHAISLFATLSARDRIREGLNSAPALADNKIDTSIAIYDAGYLRTSCSRSRSKSPANVIRVDVEVERSVEMGEEPDEMGQERASRHGRSEDRQQGVHNV